MVANPFIPIPPPKYGGTERVIAYLTRGLIEAGHRVSLFATGDSTAEAEIIPICDRHLFFGINKQEQEEIKVKADEIQLHTLELLREHSSQFDIVHSHGFDLKDFTDIPSVTTLHGMFKLEQIPYYEERQHLNFISISDNQRQSNPELQYIGTVYNGLDPEEFPFNAKPAEYVCFLGRLDREKNPDLAIKMAIQAGVPIKVAGKIDFKGQGYIEEEIKPLLEHPLVEFLGEIDMRKKIELLSNARCNLHPTGFREPFGLTILEAAYCGTPTIAIRKGSMPELIEDGRTGVLVEDFTEAYFHLEKACSLDRNYISTRSRSLFNYTRMTEQYVQLYREAIEQAEAKKTHPLAVEFSVIQNLNQDFLPKYLIG